MATAAAAEESLALRRRSAQRRSDGTISEQLQHQPHTHENPSSLQQDKKSDSLHGDPPSLSPSSSSPPPPVIDSGLSRSDSLARLLDPDYRAQVQNFQELLTPETLPQIQQGLSPADLQQLQTIMFDAQVLGHLTDGKLDEGQGQQRHEDSAASSSSSGSSSSMLGGRAERASAHDSMPKPPSLEQLRVMQETKIAVQQLPADFTSYLARMLGGVGDERLSALTAMMGEPQLHKLESLYQEVLGFSKCSLEDLPTQYVQISNKMEELALELTQIAPASSSGPSPSPSSSSRASIEDDGSATESSVRGGQGSSSSSLDSQQLLGRRDSVGLGQGQAAHKGAAALEGAGGRGLDWGGAGQASVAGSTGRLGGGSTGRQGVSSTGRRLEPGRSGRRVDGEAEGEQGGVPEHGPEGHGPEGDPEGVAAAAHADQPLQEPQQQQQRRGFLQGLKQGKGSRRKGLGAARGRLFPPAGETP